MKAAIKIVWLLALLWTTQMALGQTIIKHYTVEDGLPSNEVYFVHQDSYGYFWFCTDRGISRYNGYKFTNFSTSDGLTNNTVFKVFEDDKSNLWFTTIDGTITIFNRKLNKFLPYEHNDWLKSNYDTQKWVHYIGFKKATQEVFFVMLKNVLFSEIHVITREGTKKPLSSNILTQNLNYLDNISVIGLTKVPLAFNYIVILKPHVNLPTQYSSLIQKKELEFGGNSSYFLIANSIYATTNNGLCKFNSTLTDYITPEITATSAYKDNEGFLWVSSANKGVFIYSETSLIKKSSNLVLSENESIDRGKALNGHFVIPSNKGSIIVLDSFGKVINRLQNSGYNGKVSGLFYNKDSTSVFYDHFSVVNKNNSFSLKTTHLETMFRGGFSFDFKGHKITPFVIEPVSNRTWGNIIGINSSIFSNNLIDFCLKNNLYESFDSLSDFGIIEDHFISKKYALVATDKGLYKLNSLSGVSELVKLGVSNNTLSIKELDVFKDYIFLSTKGYGLQILRGEKHIISLRAKNGLASDFVNSTFVDTVYKQIWCGTNSGISILQYTILKNRITVKILGTISRLNGLSSNYVNFIGPCGTKLFIITNEGVNVIPKSYKVKKQSSPNLNLLGYQIDETFYSENDLKFDYTENNLVFRYEALTSRKVAKMYRCRLFTGNDTTPWNLTDEINYSVYNLPAGSYTFQVCARAVNSDWGVPKVITFTIRPRFMDRWKVRGFILATIAAIAFYLIKRRERRLKKESELALAYKQLELQNAQLESSTLRGQMNPHLVFNVLNSIQKLILKEEKDNANKLLTRFSKLIRSALKYSRFEFIPLQDEIEFLGNYINIEHQRFPERFTYRIEQDEELQDSEIKIPPLIIQPICENAVKHAFVSNGGKLSVSIKAKSETMLEVIIMDDGVGILNSTTNKESSLGLKIIKDRLKLFENEGHQTSLKFYYLDEENKKGTKVVLQIPYQ